MFCNSGTQWQSQTLRNLPLTAFRHIPSFSSQNSANFGRWTTSVSLLARSRARYCCSINAPPASASPLAAGTAHLLLSRAPAWWQQTRAKAAVSTGKAGIQATDTPTPVSDHVIATVIKQTNKASASAAVQTHFPPKKPETGASMEAVMFNTQGDAAISCIWCHVWQFQLFNSGRHGFGVTG